jgi:RNA polymerase sigma-70 factor (ECF subfamily)
MTDAHPFEAFVRRFQDMVFATAVRLLGNPTDAEDVAQTVFLRAFERFDVIGESPAAAGWLRTVTRNACLNHLTRYRARWRLFSELSDPGGLDRENDVEARSAGPAGPGGTALLSERSPASDLERADLHARLERALQSLPDHQRVPLVLFHFEEASYQDIAETLGVSLAKVKTDIHRGRERLKQLLDTR